MKKKFALLLSTAMLASVLTVGVAQEEIALAAGSPAKSANAAVTAKAAHLPAPLVSQAAVDSGTMTIYDFGDSKLHVYSTGDALGDVAYIVEGADALVGIELPGFTEGLEAWQKYIASLNKPMQDIFLCDHTTGASYIQGMHAYGTAGAQESIKGGITYATTQGLYDIFGSDFHGGPDMANINRVVSGKVTVAGIEFELIDHGETYDLVIPSMNAVYTHMLGKTTHSILTSPAHMDALLETLKGYQQADYAMIITSHSGVEGQDAVAEKIRYVEKTKELAAANDNAADFVSAMQQAFPEYDGANYLEMTASALYH